MPDSAIPHAGPVLPHLAGSSAGLRQAMAAHVLRGHRHVIEIGGAGLPVSGYLRPIPESVTVIDPKIEPLERDMLAGEPCRLRHIRAKVQAVDLPELPACFALVMLGLSLKPSGGGEVIAPGLRRLLAAASLIVIDHAVELRRATDQLPAILAASGLPVSMTVGYEIDDGTIGISGFGRRRFLVLGVPASS
jgi:hypothetical protein